MVYGQADAALYWAKRHGRGSVEVFDPERDRLPEEHHDATGHAVEEVITGKLLRPVFQPIVDLRTGHVLGFEGLIRPDPEAHCQTPPGSSPPPLPRVAPSSLTWPASRPSSTGLALSAPIGC